MNDAAKTHSELLTELAELQRQVAVRNGCQGSVGGATRADCQWVSLIANSPLIVAVIDARHCIRYVNRTETQVPASELIGKPIYDFAASGQESEWRRRLEGVFATGCPDFYESCAIREDGLEQWYQGYLGPIYEKDRVVAVSLAIVNISAHKTAEQERDRTKAILAAAIDCLPFEFFAIGNDGRYILQNAVARGLCGNVIGTRPEDLAPNEASLTVWQDSNQRAFAGERVASEYSAPSPGGEVRHYYNVVAPVRDARHCYGILGINVDITRRKKAEEALQKVNESLEIKVHERTNALQAANEALRQSCDELQAIYEGMSDGLVIADMETLSIVYANRAICHMLGYEEAEFLKTTLEQRHPAGTLPRIPEYRKAIAEGRMTHLENLPLLHRNGSLVYFDLAFQRIFYRESPCVVIFYHDVTQSRLARAALERQQRALQHMLEASDHERQLIAYDIHDGLAQHLAGAMMQFEVFEHLRKSGSADADSVFRAAVNTLRQSHVETRRLISGVRPPILDESGVLAAIEHLVHDRMAQGAAKIRVRGKIDFQRLAPILENAIYRIVQETLNNACKYSQSKAIRVSIVQRGRRLRVAVRDWGIGFDVKTARKNRFGLEGIRERARLLGGKCSIRSELGQGTVIAVELPIVERHVDESDE